MLVTKYVKEGILWMYAERWSVEVFFSREKGIKRFMLILSLAYVFGS